METKAQNQEWISDILKLVKVSKSSLTTIPALEHKLSLMMLILTVNELPETFTNFVYRRFNAFFVGLLDCACGGIQIGYVRSWGYGAAFKW